MEPSDPQKCIIKGKSEVSVFRRVLSNWLVAGSEKANLSKFAFSEKAFDCHNHIKVIQPINKVGDKLYLCGTNAYNPRDYLVHAANLSVSQEAALGIGSGAQAECPFDPDDNSTAVWVERGNPSDSPALYTGTATDINKADPLIFRTELYNQTSGFKIHEAKRTTKYDSKWLDSKYPPARHLATKRNANKLTKLSSPRRANKLAEPNFVGSFEIGDYVYFFFRESAVEYINCGKSIYSRVARVCKVSFRRVAGRFACTREREPTT